MPKPIAIIAGPIIAAGQSLSAALDWLKFRSGTAAFPVAQAAERQFTTVLDTSGVV